MRGFYLVSVVYLLLMNIGDVRSLLLRATTLGMTQPEYLYIVPDIEGFEHTGLDVWRRNDSNDDVSDFSSCTFYFKLCHTSVCKPEERE